MGNKILEIGTVHQCNRCLGSETLRPLVSVIGLSRADLPAHTGIKFDFYTILLGERKCKAHICDYQHYDFSDDTLLFPGPGESINMKENSESLPSEGWILAFHPDLICNTLLRLNIHNYTFLSHLSEKALHISLCEKQIILELMDEINQELERCTGRHGRKIVSKYIELLLDYCIRFYECQFTTRNEANKTIIKQSDKIINNHSETKQAPTADILSHKYCANPLHLSPEYFDGLLEYEMGESFKEYIELKRFETARDWLASADKTINRITRELDFQNPQYLSRLFKKIVGCFPNGFRMPD